MKKILSALIVMILLQPATYLMAQNNTGKMDDQVRADQIKELKFGMFICWSFSTFSGMEWTPTLDKDASYFKATGCDTDQWCKAMKAAGMKLVVITAKHHDGFVLWQSRYTEHGVMSSPFRNGKGDIMKDLSESCRKYGIKLGVYLSPADLYQIESKTRFCHRMISAGISLKVKI